MFHFLTSISEYEDMERPERWSFFPVAKVSLYQNTILKNRQLYVLRRYYMKQKLMGKLTFLRFKNVRKNT